MLQSMALGTMVWTKYQSLVRGQKEHTSPSGMRADRWGVLPVGFDLARAPVPTKRSLLAPVGCWRRGSIKRKQTAISVERPSRATSSQLSKAAQ